MAKQWEMNPNTRDYVLELGAPKQTGSLKMPAYFRLRIKRKTWLYAPNDQLGSDYHLQKKRHSTQDPSATEAIGVRALQPLIDDGRADEITVETVETARHGVGLAVKITDAQGEPEQLNLDKVGS